MTVQETNEKFASELEAIIERLKDAPPIMRKANSEATLAAMYLGIMLNAESVQRLAAQWVTAMGKLKAELSTTDDTNEKEDN